MPNYLTGKPFSTEVPELLNNHLNPSPRLQHDYIYTKAVPFEFSLMAGQKGYQE